MYVLAPIQVFVSSCIIIASNKNGTDQTSHKMGIVYIGTKAILIGNRVAINDDR